MQYEINNFGYNGVRFKKVKGDIGDIYNTIETALENLYKNSNLILKKPLPKPNFEDFDRGETELEPFQLVMKKNDDKEVKHGKIGIKYFKGQKKETINNNADYAVSGTFSHTGGDVTYEAITLFFNTFPLNNKGKSIEQSRKIERDKFISTIDDLMVLPYSFAKN